MDNRYTINIKASNNLFKEIGNIGYDTKDILSEFVDNSIEAKRKGVDLRVDITIAISKINPQNNNIEVIDNGVGIPREKIAEALSPASLSGGTTLNEHGMGLKQAIASLGELDEICTKTIEDEKASVIKELKFEMVEVELRDIDIESGTIIRVRKAEHLSDKYQHYAQKINLQLGARYRRFLGRGLSIGIKIWDIDNDEEKWYWELKAIEPIYFNPITMKNEAIGEKKMLSGEGWKATFTLGYAPTDSEYKVLGIDKRMSHEPYSVTLNNQGFDIIMNERVIEFCKLSEIKLVEARHSNYNYIRGEIELLEGFKTSTTKSKIIWDSNFNELLERISAILKEGKYLYGKVPSDKLPEKVIRDRLALSLSQNPLIKRENVKVDKHIEAINGRIGIYSEKNGKREAWMIKAGNAICTDLYQLLCYMDMDDINTGYLVGNSFSEEVKYVTNYMKSRYNKDIELFTTESLKLTYELTEEEKAEYFSC